MKRLLNTLAILVVLANGATAATAAELRVNVVKTPVKTEDGKRLMYVVFSDEPLVVDATLILSELPVHRLPKADLERLRALGSNTWTDRVSWTLQNRATHDGASIPSSHIRILRSSRSEHGPHAADPTLRKSGVDYVLYEARLNLGNVPPGDYALDATMDGLKNEDTFEVRRGDETPQVRDAFLARQAARASTYDEYRRLQLERLTVSPYNATILTDLAQRSLASGDLAETNSYYDRAVSIVQDNVQRYAKEHPADAAHVEQGGQRQIAHIRAAQKLLPEYFSRRDELKLDEMEIDGTWRYVLKDRVTGRVVREATDQ